MKLILIRHGQTQWNQERRYLSFTNIGLNNKGKKQARRLAQRLEKEKIDKVYSSDSKRALQFARIVFRGFVIKKESLLREINFGIFEGMTYKEIKKKYPEIYKRWLKDPINTIIPNGERINDYRVKNIKIFRKILSHNKNETIAAVCHGGTISVFINSILKSKKIFKYIPNPAAISIIEYKNGRPKIKLFNDTSHLDG